MNKPETGHFAKAGVTTKRFLKEFRLEMLKYEFRSGNQKQISFAGDHIDATAKFPKVKASRAQSRDMASPEDLWLTVLNITDMQGSNGSATTPVKVFKKGKGMPGTDGCKSKSYSSEP